MRSTRVLLRAVLALLAVLLVAGTASTPQPRVYGPDFHICIQFCEGFSDLCFAEAREDCTLLVEGDQGLIAVCTAMGNIDCLADYRGCRDTCRAVGPECGPAPCPQATRSQQRRSR